MTIIRSLLSLRIRWRSFSSHFRSFSLLTLTFSLTHSLKEAEKERKKKKITMCHARSA